jgi:inward rectifier potassium channel
MPRKRTWSRPKALRPPGADYNIQLLGERRAPLRDFYHALLRRPWRHTIAAICAGVAHAGARSFIDAFFFSVQTMGTIGYGAMYPESAAANVLVVAESITSLTLTALATGLMFAKFSRSTARLIFTREAVISPVGGVPTLMFRLSNQRGNLIVDAHIQCVLTRKEITTEGHTFYRMLDLHPTRERVLSLSRSWSVQHPIDEKSPLHGKTPGDLLADESEIGVMVTGLDETSMQPIHASHLYYGRQVVWGARHADILSEAPNGDLVLDLARFHDTEPTPPSPQFPYPTARDE